MSAPTHAWLQRLSDYHSGTVSEAERIAVEAHLAECAECQEALATYRRFYLLLRSPLQLGEPSARFDETTMPLTTRSPESRARTPIRPPRGPHSPRRRALAGLAAGLAAALIIAGFVALIGTHLRPPTVAGTPSPRVTPSAQPSMTPQPSPTPSPFGTPQPGAFVCANPQGSSMTYAYVRADGLLYVVTGCAAPRQLGSAPMAPIGWSPSNQYLAMVAAGPSAIADRQVTIIDVQSGAITQTSYVVGFANVTHVGDIARIFFGWLDDSSFLGGITTVTNNPQGFEQAGPTTLERVDVGSGRETTLGSIAGWVYSTPGRVVAHGRYLFYAGYDSAGTTAYLHRFDLTSGTDTQLVSLGLYAPNGCQGALAVCGWTAPWNVSPDGAHILYHHPGAASVPNNIYAAKDTPVLYATPNGSGASTPFGSQLAASIVAPVFSPDGSAAALADSTYAGTNPPSDALNQIKVVRFGGTPMIVTGGLVTWRGDGAALVIAPNSGLVPVLYDLATGKTTPLEAGSGNYLWGN